MKKLENQNKIKGLGVLLPITNTDENISVKESKETKGSLIAKSNWIPDSHVKELSNESLENVDAETMLVRGFTVETGFEFQIRKNIDSAVSALRVKYTNILLNNVDFVEVVKSISKYLSSIDISGYLGSNVNILLDDVLRIFSAQHFFDDIQSARYAYETKPQRKDDPKVLPFKLCSYITPDISIVIDFATMYTQMLEYHIYRNINMTLESSIKFVDLKSDDLNIFNSILMETVNMYIDEAYSLFTNIFFNAHIVANNYNNYIIYKGLNNK